MQMNGEVIFLGGILASGFFTLSVTLSVAVFLGTQMVGDRLCKVISASSAQLSGKMENVKETGAAQLEQMRHQISRRLTIMGVVVPVVKFLSGRLGRN